MRRYLATAAVAALAMLTTLGGLLAPAQAAGTGTVSVLHAVPGLTVDVYANGQKLLSNFKPGTLTDPQMLPAGSYDITIFAAGKGPSGTPAIEADDVEVKAGVNATIVAHLTAAGKPTASVYANDVSTIAAGKARLIVRHDAAAPAVDIRADKSVLVKGLTNPKQASAIVPADTYSADVVLAGTSTVAIGPADLMLAEGTTTIVYAWGSASDKNLKLAVQTISGMNGGGGVNGGEAGLAAQPDSSVPIGAVGGLVALGAGAVVALTVVRRRSATAGR
jgi:hypothetical protein